MGDALTLEEGLCHIGEWHSHHKLNIPRPSTGDESTVWSNMDRYGLSRFCLLIANITTTWNWTSLSLVPCDVMVNGFLFEVGHQRQRRRRLPVIDGQFTFLREGSPFRSKYVDMIEEGAESMNIEIECRDQSESELKKRCQEIQETLKELEASLAEERNSHDETRSRSNGFERALAAERQLRKETERNLKGIEQRLQIYEMARHPAETQTREWQNNEQMWHAYLITVQETERRLQSSLQRAKELQTALFAQMQAKEDSEQRSQELETSLAEQRQAREETEKRLNDSQQRSQELETSLAEQRKAREETKKRLQKSQLRESELKKALAEEQCAHEETKRNLMRSSNPENNASTVQQNIVEYNSSRDASCGSEITMSNSVIREGKWGHVVEGRFRGRKVAVKVVHPNIVPFLDQSVLQREIKMAFDCSHPCLLHFFGVSYRQGLLFVTELLETNLRAVLQERALEDSEITTIALDVAEGLNYLHCKSPAAPIVHQEISSANVLLWKESDNWRAKVSDCITDRILQQSMAVSPFDVRYAAPETRTLLSPKIDIFSFGVLLCEMNLRDLPAGLLQINNQVNSLSYRNPYKWLIKECVREFPNIRPSMEKIIEKLKRL